MPTIPVLERIAVNHRNITVQSPISTTSGSEATTRRRWSQAESSVGTPHAAHERFPDIEDQTRPNLATMFDPGNHPNRRVTPHTARTRRASGQDSDGRLVTQAAMRSHRHNW